MTIAVLCPSRGNPKALFEAAASCTATAMDGETEFIAVVDRNDPEYENYFRYNEDYGLKIAVIPEDESGNMNLALNFTAPMAAENYDIVGFVGDDHRFRTKGWDRVIQKVLDDEGGGFAYGNDLARNDIPTQVFISSPIIRALGWMGLPGAKHLYLDNTWQMLGERSDCLYYLPDVVIEHMHPSVGKGEWDENHRRVNTGEMYQHDAKVFEAWLAEMAEADIAKVRAAPAMTTVSAIIPTYNRVESLMDVALPSILKQTRPVDEIVIVGDGMEGDQLIALESAVASVQDGRYKLFNIERPWYPGDAGSIWSIQGYAARNKGLDEAIGEWIAPLDDDDEWTDDHVEVLLNAAIEKDVQFAYGKSITPWNQNYGHWPPSGMNFCDGAQVYRNGMGYRYDPECLKRWLPADADIWNRMVAGGVTFTFVDQLVHLYYPAPR